MKLINKSIGALILTILLMTAANGIQAQARRQVVKAPSQTATVYINEQGYSLTSIKLKRGVPTRITFLRQTENTCATEIVIPAYGINKPLPLFQRVTVNFTPKKSGEFGFTCGMNMMRGKLIVR